MKLLTVLGVALVMPWMAWAGLGSLEGEWKLASMIYQGQPMPLPNPELNLRWHFFSNGTERLFWDRGTSDFCESWAHYSVESGFLKSEVFALNPRNALDCSRDPDMQVGRKTSTPIEVFQDRVHLRFSLGDEVLIYVLHKIET